MSINVMLDLETWGTRPGCAVISIGAVVFGPKGVDGESFSAGVGLRSCVNAGLTVDPSTKQWWSDQSGAARVAFHKAQKEEYPSLALSLNGFREWFQGLEFMDEKVLVWGNGSDFDNAILDTAFNRAGFGGAPWKFWANRCYRTVKNLRPALSPLNRIGTHHNSLDDAKTQAAHAVLLLNDLGAWE